MKENKNFKPAKKYLLIIAVFAVILIATFLCLQLETEELKKSLGTDVNNFKDDKFTKILEIDRSGEKATALQGSTGVGGEIYYTITKSGASGQSNYYTTIGIYGKDKKAKIIQTFSSFFQSNKTYKINDITTNTTVGRNYYLAYDATHKKESKVVFSQGGITRNVTLKASFNPTNIAYRSYDNKYYVVKSGKTSNEIYNFTMPITSSDNKNNNLGSTKLSKVCKIKKDTTLIKSTDNVVAQGITMKESTLFVIFQVKPNDNTYKNYIGIYDLRNCNNEKTTLTPITTLNVGECKASNNTTRCELESMFFMNNKMYLGYNNSKFNGFSFYTLNTNNNLTTSITAKKTSDGKITLTGKASSKDYGIYNYKFCDNKEGTNCSAKAIKNSKGNYSIPLSTTVTKNITNNNSNWYFIVSDIFGNKFTSVITKKELNALK